MLIQDDASEPTEVALPRTFVDDVPDFQHVPLETSKLQIRLFGVTEGFDGYNYHLYHFNLESAPPYRALSYT
jgi:hypothetical protein